MTADWLYLPALPLVFGAFLLGFVPRRFRRGAFLIFPLIALFMVTGLLTHEHTWSFSFAHYELTPLKVDSLSLIFGFIFALTAFIGGVYAFHIEDGIQQSAALLYAGGAMGVTFAGDFFTLFVFWEIMAVSSTVLIWARRTPATDNAGVRYLVFHIFGGGLLFAGILLHSMKTGSLQVEALPAIPSLPAVLILLGVALNAAVPPLHAWLPDAYPKATVTGAVFLVAFTTKSAVYVLIRVYPGWEILIWTGVAMAIYGTIFAIMVSDIREILAYSTISQVGYMVAGVGIGTEMALNGATIHAFSHILYKCLLFMGAGAVLYSTGKSNLAELGGIAGKMKGVVVLYMIGALSISGFPLFNGFISKSMIVSAAGYAHYDWPVLLLLLASMGTFIHTGLKLPCFTWFGKSRSEITAKPCPRNFIVAMSMGAFLCTLFGIFPGLIYHYLPYPVDYHPYSTYHLVETTQILIFAFIGFWLLRKYLLPEGDNKIVLDLDWLYRKPGARLASYAVSGVSGLFAWCEKRVQDGTRAAGKAFVDPTQWLIPAPGPRRTVSTQPTGAVIAMILLVFVLSSLFLFI